MRGQAILVVLASLMTRHLRRPVLAVADGNPGLLAALQTHWPGLAVQRCTAHYADLRIMPMSMTNGRSTAVSPMARSA
jgi:transposase-like protein